MRRGHGGSGDGVDGVLAANPSGKNVQTGGEDVSALSVVGEVGTFITQSGGADGDGVLSSGRGVVASIGVVVASSDGEVDAGVNGGIHGEVQGARAATAERHVGNATLEALSLTFLGSLGLLDVRLSSPLDTLDDVGHGTRTVGAQDLDGVDIGLLGDTVLLTSDGARAVSTVAVAVLIGVTLGDGLAPVGTALKVSVLGVGASVNHVGINALTAILSIQVLVEATKGQTVPVGNTGQTPGGVLLNLICADLGVSLDVVDLDDTSYDQRELPGVGILWGLWAATHIRMLADLLNNILVEVASIPHQRASHVEGMLQASIGIGVKAEQRPLLQLHAAGLGGVDILHPAVVGGSSRRIDMLLKHDDIRVRDFLGARGGKDGGGTVVDGAHHGR